MRGCKVFYSWQSDLPNSTNRSFIEKALENAAKSIRADDSIKVEPVIDRDTAGVPGSPDIAGTIFAKIEESQVFVCDVSIINEGEKSRSTPNPNVLIELGYALKTLGSERVLMVMNTVFGKPELLPFDLSRKRVVTYHMPEECEDRAAERKKLEAQLDTALRTILTHIEAQPQGENPVQKLKKYLVDDRYRIQLDDLIKEQTKELLNFISQTNTLPPVNSDSDPYVDLTKILENQTNQLRDTIITGCYYGEEKHDKIWSKCLEQILNPPGTNLLSGLKRYPALILLYAGGISSLLAEKYHTLRSLLLDTQYIDGHEKRPLIFDLSAWDIVDRRIGQRLPNQENKITPVSNHLFELFREPLSDIMSNSSGYEEYFDRYEYFFALVRADMAYRTGLSCNVAIGRFVTKCRVRIRDDRVYKSGIVEDIETEANKYGNNWGPLKAGFFDGKITRFLEIKDDFDKNLEKLCIQLRFR
jgi:hypothetical protein